MCTGEANPGPVRAWARSVAIRTSELRGSSSSPRLNVFMATSGEAIAISTPAPAASATTGWRMTASAQRVQNTSLPSSVVRHGSRTRSRSMRLPAPESSAVSKVVAASTEMQTTTIAPIAIDRRAETWMANSAASDTATVAPLNTTAVPELASARRSASCSEAPSRSSRRNRLTMKSE